MTAFRRLIQMSNFYIYMRFNGSVYEKFINSTNNFDLYALYILMQLNIITRRYSIFHTEIGDGVEVG